MLNIAFLLVLVDVICDMYMPQIEKQRKKLNGVCGKNGSKDQKCRTRGVGTKFCTRQYLYISE